MINKKAVIAATAFLFAAAGHSSVHAHSTTKMGPLLSSIHSWLHAGGGELLAGTFAALAGVWLVVRHLRQTRH